MTRSDPEMRYLLDAKPVFEALRREMVHLSAFLLWQLTASPRRLVDLAPVEIAAAAIAETRERLGGLSAPLSATHHRSHLEGAARALERAQGITLRRARFDRDALFRALEDAELHLRAASRALPGFEIVDFSQACCAAHAEPAAQALRCSG